MRELISALQFLTVIPIPFKTDENSLGRSVPYFPIAGLCIGALSALIYWITAFYFKMPANVASLSAIISLALFSGGLHLDGLADTADGLFSHRSKEKTLEIMNDSRIGTMGVLALIFAILSKWIFISSIREIDAFKILFLSPCASRTALSVSLLLFPYARYEGLVGVFKRNQKIYDWVFPVLFSLATGWICFYFTGVLIVFIAVISGLIFSLYCLKRIDGITGDTLGAVSETGELISFIAIFCFCL